ncbi:MAG: ABC transporter permease [Candidatus Saccharimonadales bacterium]
MNNAATICRKELRDIVRNKLFVALFAALGFVIILSIVIGAIDFHSKLIDYQHYLQALKATSSAALPQTPQLFPLQLLIGGLEYLEIVGALLAIIVGYGMVAKEKTRGTLGLLFSRPLKPFDIAVGKIGALLAVWLAFSVFLGVAIVIVLLIVGGASLSGTDIGRLAICLALIWIYLTFWSTLAVGFASRTKQLSAALILSLCIWLVIVLILPQIGDTMDPDNQVPGGLFNTLHVSTAQQNSVMSHFTAYESSRNYIESASVEKHFERATFGFTGVKPEYNQKSIAYVFNHLWVNVLTVFLAALAGIGWALTQCRKRYLIRK